MSLEAVLTARLRADAGVAGLVALRIYPVDAPPDAKLPHLVYRIVSSERPRAMRKDTRVERVRVQITAKATGFDGARTLAEAVAGALRDWRDYAASPEIHDCQFESAFDGFDERRSPSGAGPGAYRRNVDFFITCRSNPS